MNYAFDPYQLGHHLYQVLERQLRHVFSMEKNQPRGDGTLSSNIAPGSTGHRLERKGQEGRSW